MKVAMASDHGGFELKNTLKQELEAMGHEVVDFGCDSTASVDYPDYGYKAAKAVATGECEKGVVI